MILSTEKEKPGLQLRKVLTGIRGLDDITEGGLPENRTTIICGNAGCGKTVLSMEFLVGGAVKYHAPGVFMSFEETTAEIMTNMESFQFGLAGLVKKKKIYIEYVEVDKNQVLESGKYDLEGLFVRIQHAIKRIGAKRVVLDSLDALFYGLDNRLIRHEIKRLFKWLKEEKVTALITSENGTGFISKNGLEKYIADCVIVLDDRTTDQITTRRLKIMKMRGSAHGINEYPFTIDENGISVLPLISQLADRSLSTNRVSSGIKDLDGMLDGKGFFEGSSILVSGSAGTGKTSIAVSLIEATCRKKIPALYCAFEESASQIVRNMRSIGLNIEPFIKSGILKVYSSRPTIQNLELHLIAIQKIIEEFKPKILVVDPVTNLITEGINSEIRQMLAHFVDFLKAKDITTLFTAAITLETIKTHPSDEGISAMVDTWILVRDIETNSERNRGIYILKSRGMSHSTQVREFVITDEGISILPIYIGAKGVLTGSAKFEHFLGEKEKDRMLSNKSRDDKNDIERNRKKMEEDITLLKSQFNAESGTVNQDNTTNELNKHMREKDKMEIIGLRNKSKRWTEKAKSINK
jgi:circadian clock protein KaiC